MVGRRAQTLQRPNHRWQGFDGNLSFPFASFFTRRNETVTAIKTLIWSIIVGGTATVGIPYLLLASTDASFSVRLTGLRLFGLALIFFGAMIYAWSASTFTFIGKGTPAPFDPPKELVAKGPYQYVRNPIYVFVIIVLVGEAMYFQNAALIIYAVLALLFFHFWIVFYAEPVLRRRFGKSYEVYCASVSRWFPRLPKTQR